MCLYGGYVGVNYSKAGCVPGELVEELREGDACALGDASRAAAPRRAGDLRFEGVGDQNRKEQAVQGELLHVQLEDNRSDTFLPQPSELRTV